MIDRLITALNKMSNNVMVLTLFVLGVLTAIAGFVLVAKFPGVDRDIAKGLAGLGAVIVGGAMMGFRGGTSESKSVQNPDGTSTTKQATGDPEPPKV